jgi:monoamine oxidase
LWDKYTQPVLSDVRAMRATAAPRGVLADYDRITFSEFLRRQGASPGAITILKLGFVFGQGDGADSVSALNVLRESIHRGEAKHSYTIRGGSDSLPKAFAARLAERIYYGVPVIRIEQDGEGVRVICSQIGSNRTFSGDYLVCAVPFSVLKRIVVSPAFSREKTAAIERLEYTSVTRVYMQTRKRFWYDEGLSGNASTDLPVMGIYERTINQPGTRGILESYMAGSQARRMTAMKDTERIDAVVDGAKMIYPAISENFEGGASKCWDEDEWSRGAYAWFRPGQMGTLLPHIARSEGRIHFAGEHASASPGWMQGALESGNRAAREINDLTG